MTTTYNPFRDMDRVFNQLARNAASEARSMPMDLYRDGDEFIVKIDLPGVSADSIDIDVDDRTLTVRAERTQTEMSTEGENNRWVARERSFAPTPASWTRAPAQPGADQRGSTSMASWTLRIPAAEEAKPRKVKVNQGQVAGEIDTNQQDDQA